MSLEGTVVNGRLVLRKVKRGPRTYWEVQCVQCGDTMLVQVNALEKKAPGCPKCLRKQLSEAKKHGAWQAAAFLAAYNATKTSVRSRDISFSLSFEHWQIIVQMQCYWCGRYPHRETAAVRRCTPKETPLEQRIFLHTLDRIDCSRGYSTGNVVAACLECNRMHSDTDPDEFIARCRMIAGKHPEKPE